MENQFKKLIKSRLSNKGITVVHDNTIQEVDFLRMYFKETKPKNRLHVFTMIPNTDRAKTRWYESVFYDNSMDAQRKNDIKTETSVDQAITDYFLQEFKVSGEIWLLRWS